MSRYDDCNACIGRRPPRSAILHIFRHHPQCQSSRFPHPPIVNPLEQSVEKWTAKQVTQYSLLLPMLALLADSARENATSSFLDVLYVPSKQFCATCRSCSRGSRTLQEAFNLRLLKYQCPTFIFTHFKCILSQLKPHLSTPEISHSLLPRLCSLPESTNRHSSVFCTNPKIRL